MRNYTASLCVVLTLPAVQASAQTKQHPTDAANSLRDEIVAQERAGLEALKSGDIPAFADSTAPDAVFADASSIATKTEVVKNVANFHLREFTMTDMHFLALSPESGLIVYRLAESDSSHGKDFTAKAIVSAIWAKRGGKWQRLLSQETPSK